jgi:hypothetical protein
MTTETRLTPDPQPRENTAQTMRKAMEDLSHSEFIEARPGDPADLDFEFTNPMMITVPRGREVKDLTAAHIQQAEFFKPARRRGTAKLDDLASLINWANRNKGDTTVLFAKPDMAAPSLTCIADYHGAGPADPLNGDGDPTARHLSHRGVYAFPLSDEWKAWMKVDDRPLNKDEMGEFIEANAKDVMDPTPAILRGEANGKDQQEWESRLIRTAQQIEGRYGQLTQLLAMSRQFAVHEVSNLTISSNRDTGEASIQFLNEHKAADGAPLKIPNLIIIQIPVFVGGAVYRMPVRFRYRKIGGEVKFILSIYNPDRAFKDAFDEAVTKAKDDTGLPVFLGTPEERA